MFDSEQNNVMNTFKSNGDQQKGQSQDVYLKSGTYYIRVKSDSLGGSNSVAYNLSVNYTENIGVHETEINNQKEAANIITQINKPITGNLRIYDDVDFYKFTTVSSGKIYLEFKHKDTEYTLSVNGTVSLENPIKVLLNGKQIEFDQPPIIQDGRTLVPLRAIFEAMEATVLWDNETKTVTSIKLDTIIVLKIGDNILKKNKDEIELDVPAQIVNGRTLVPVRAIAESFGSDVGWDGATKTVIITQE